MFFRKSDKTKLKDKDFNFCQDCQEEEVSLEIEIFDEDDNHYPLNLCRKCAEKRYPINKECKYCETEEGLKQYRCKDLDGADEILTLCEDCRIKVLNSGDYIEVELVLEDEEH